MRAAQMQQAAANIKVAEANLEQGTAELKDAERQPSSAWQSAKGPDVGAYFLEEEDFHDAGCSVEQRGEDLQDPQEDVHR